MYILFKEIALTNFGSVSHTEFSLTPGIFHIKGINEDNSSSQSNGSGKSTIFSESFRWIIFGSTSKKLSSDGVVNDTVGKDCMGMLRASITEDNGNTVEVEIRRYRMHSVYSNSLELLVDGRIETKQKMVDTQKEIEALFKLPISVFSSVYLMEQGLNSKFTSMSNVDSKSYIESLRNVKVWDHGYFSAGARVKALATELQTVVSIRDQNTAVINSKTQEVFRLETTVAEIQEEIRIAHETSGSANKLERYSSGVAELAESKKSILSLDESSKSLKDIVDSLRESLTEKKTKVILKQSELTKIQSTLGSLSCSSCGRDFDNREESEKHINSEVSRITAELEPLTESSREALEKYNTELSKYTSSSLSISDLKSKFNSSLAALEVLRRELEESKTRELLYAERERTIRSSIVSINSDVSSLRESNTKVESKVVSLTAELPYYKELVNIFSFKGIRSYLINNDIEFLNEKMREFSTFLFSDMLIQLFPSLNSEGMVTSIDVIAMCSSGKERLYNALSGGEKKRADICIQLGIREFVRRIYNVDTNLFSLDEIFDGLDGEGAYNVMELINEVSNPDTTIYIISHREINHFNGGTITVIKQGGLTRIES